MICYQYRIDIILRVCQDGPQRHKKGIKIVPRAPSILLNITISRKTSSNNEQSPTSYVENDVSEAIEEVIEDVVNDEMEQEEEMDDGRRMLRMDDDEEFEFDEVFLGNGSVAEEVDAVPDNWMPRLL